MLQEINATLYAHHCRTEDQVVEVASDADAIITEYAPLTWRVIASLSKCRIIAVNATGVDNVDVKAATEYGIPVTNVPEYCTDEVSDHTLALLLACARKVVWLHEKVRQGIWDWKSCGAIRCLRGKVLGLIGFGKIARAVATKAKVFGLEVIAYDPYVPETVFRTTGAKMVNLEELLRAADYVSVHVPLTEETRHSISAKELSLMKPGAYLLNLSRGPVVDQQALTAALQERRIAGAALDVLESEPPPPGELIVLLPNAIITPHVAFYSEEAILQVRQTSAARL
jgi:D-3-phosphoglycerate dehydrogenase